MDIKTLQALGLSVEDLSQRIVDQAVESLLYSNGFNPTQKKSAHTNHGFSARLKNASKPQSIRRLQLLPKSTLSRVLVK